jgi:hypothetical protein
MAIKLENTTFDPSEDGFNPVPPGIYPAHIVEVQIRTFDDTGKSVYNLYFKAADEVEQLDVPKMISDGNGSFTQASEDGTPKTISGSFIKGKRFRLNNGMWLTPNPEQGKGWTNRNYVRWCEAVGVEFPKTKDGKLELVEVEEDDILGNPCLIKVNEIDWENKTTGQSGKSMQVVDIHSWDKGTRLSKDELVNDDLPF